MRKLLSGLAARRRWSLLMSSSPTTPDVVVVVIDEVDETTVEIVVTGETAVTTVVIDVTTIDEITSRETRSKAEETKRPQIWRAFPRLSSPLSRNEGSFLLCLDVTHTQTPTLLFSMPR